MPVLLSIELQNTCSRLHQRITERFPQAALGSTCEKLLTVAKEADATIEWIRRPNWAIRIFAWTVIVFLVLTIIRIWAAFKVTFSGINVAEFFQMIDAGFNSVILLGAAGVFLMTFEARRKRKRVINAVNKLRCIAHIIDAHQLTKDPYTMAERRTASSPQRDLNEYDLGRYLDYCSEMLSIVGKVAFLYVQNFDDPAANESVNDLETLTIGFSQKIWQKIVLLNREQGD